MAAANLCELCGRWPRVASEFDGVWCGYCTWLGRSWGNDLSREHALTVGRGLPRDHWRVRLSYWWGWQTARILWIVQTFFAVRHGGPFSFWPWDRITRAICRIRDHEPVCVAESGGGWFLYRCKRCDGMASLPEGNRSYRRFAEEVDYNSIYCGFSPLSSRSEGVEKGTVE